MSNHIQKRNKSAQWWPGLFVLILSMIFLPACQHTSDDSAEENGELVIQLTDAEGDFTNYSVDVVSISLTKQNGTMVEALPENTRVDFSQYVEMTELLTSVTIPKGVYTSATLTLDYNNAEIHVENAGGESVKAENIVDENNQVITTLQSTVTLEEHKRLLIVPGVPALLSLDFDLKTSNVVSFDDSGAATVTVSPVLNASLEPDADKTHRIRGPLKRVNVNDNSFDLIIRPFNHRFQSTHERFGNFHVDTTTTTTYEINGESYTGEDGINAMVELDRLTGVIVVGEISFRPKRFTATEVYAGSSVPGGDMDAVTGVVLSRDENTIVVKGATLIRAGGSVLFNDNVTVELDSATIVKRQNDTDDYNIDAISVGQKLTVFGTLNDDTANPVLDTTDGYAYLQITTITGTVESNSGAPVADVNFALDLKNIQGRKLALFDFSGTGIDSANDAEPDFYEVETSVLDINKFPIGLPVKVRGFVNDFGQAPADFIAESIAGTEQLRAIMHTNWVPPSENAFSSISTDGITLNFEGVGRFHHLGRLHRNIDLTELDTSFTMVPNEEDKGLYIVNIPGAKHLHTTFANLVNDLESQLSAGNKVARISGTGKYEILTGKYAIRSLRVDMR